MMRRLNRVLRFLVASIPIFFLLDGVVAFDGDEMPVIINLDFGSLLAGFSAVVSTADEGNTSTTSTTMGIQAHDNKAENAVASGSEKLALER